MNLNQLIQSKIFGNKVLEDMYETYIHLNEGEFLGKRKIPLYDTNIVDAFRLIEFMTLTYRFNCVKLNNEWEICFINERVFKARSNNFCKAVSMAALKTVRI